MSPEGTMPEALEPVPGEPTVLVVDNYDSFAYNLVQYVGEFAGEVVVRRNDAVGVAGVRALDPDAVVVSPGPGTPEAAGVSMPLFSALSLPTLGVCLGHQALCAANGAPVGGAPEVVHGKPSTVTHDGTGVFDGLPERLRVGRYHSLAVECDDLPAALSETATTTDEREVAMAVRHREKPHVGVQFHPESILTRDASTDDDAATGRGPVLRVGKRLVRNFLCDTT
jgi:anthranilate synthase component 2